MLSPLTGSSATWVARHTGTDINWKELGSEESPVNGSEGSPIDVGRRLGALSTLISVHVPLDFAFVVDVYMNYKFYGI